MTLENTVFCLKTLNNDVITIFMHLQMMQYSVSNQVIFEGLWRAQEIAWSQHDFKGGHTGQAPWMMAVCSDQNYRSVIIKSKYWVLKHFPEALQCTILSYLKMVGREEAWVNLDQSHVQILTVDLNKFFFPHKQFVYVNDLLLF